MSNALKEVTGRHVPFRKNVFHNVVDDNRDLIELFSNFLQFKPLDEHDIIRISTKTNLSDQGMLIIHLMKLNFPQFIIIIIIFNF